MNINNELKLNNVSDMHSYINRWLKKKKKEKKNKKREENNGSGQPTL